MKLCFDSVDEVRAFVKNDLKGARGKGKDDDGEGLQTGQVGGQAPAPLMPPAGNMPATGGAPAFAPTTGGAPAFAPGGPAPNTMSAIVGRIVAQVDKLIAGQVPGQPAQPEAAILEWLRKQIAPHDATGAAATMDQMKQVYLNKLPEPALNEVARLIGA